MNAKWMGCFSSEKFLFGFHFGPGFEMFGGELCAGIFVGREGVDSFRKGSFHVPVFFWLWSSSARRSWVMRRSPRRRAGFEWTRF
jgi:hypothetical protein